MQLFIDVMEQNQHGVAILDLLNGVQPKAEFQTQPKNCQHSVLLSLLVIHLKTYQEVIGKLQEEIHQLKNQKSDLETEFNDIKHYFAKYVSGANYLDFC